MAVRVQAETFDPGAELAGFAAGRAGIGAQVSFIGLVRGDSGALLHMEIEHYPAMTEKAIAVQRHASSPERNDGRTSCGHRRCLPRQ